MTRISPAQPNHSALEDETVGNTNANVSLGLLVRLLARQAAREWAAEQRGTDGGDATAPDSETASRAPAREFANADAAVSTDNGDTRDD